MGATLDLHVAMVSSPGLVTAVAALEAAGLALLCLRLVGLIRSPGTAPPHRQLRRPTPHRMSDAQLCCAWRTTSVALRLLTGRHEQFAIAARRQEYLDEMECRNAPGFRAWTEAGQCCDEALEGFLVRDGGAWNLAARRLRLTPARSTRIGRQGEL